MLYFLYISVVNSRNAFLFASTSTRMRSTHTTVECKHKHTALLPFLMSYYWKFDKIAKQVFNSRQFAKCNVLRIAHLGVQYAMAPRFPSEIPTQFTAPGHDAVYYFCATYSHADGSWSAVVEGDGASVSANQAWHTTSEKDRILHFVALKFWNVLTSNVR